MRTGYNNLTIELRNNQLVNRLISLLLIIISSASILFAQEIEVHGTVTYLTSEAVYTSLGRNDWIKDSTIIIVGSQTDTIGLLKVYATSSKSSVGRILQTKRPMVIGDSVVALVERPAFQDRVILTPVSNDTVRTRQQNQEKLNTGTSASTDFVTLKGRAALQYYTSVSSSIHQVVTQPGVLLNVHGNFTNSPVSFQMYGNVRSLSYGTESPFASNSRSETRLYNFSIDYDDSVHRASIGRIIPVGAPSVGYIDGFLLARKLGDFTFGATAGYEPNFLQRGISTDYKKISLFGTYHSDGFLRPNINLAYTRTYFHSNLDREAMSVTLFSAITGDLTFTAQNELDLRSKSGNAFILAPRIGTLFSNISYRLSSMFTLSAGYTAWTPTYPYSSIRSLPDSMIDKTTRGNITTSLYAYLPYGISVYTTYSPRSTNGTFGNEYYDYSSVSFSNILNQDMALHLSTNINATTFGKTRGFGASLQRSFVNLFDLTARYQLYTYDFQLLNNSTSSHSFALDFMTLIKSQLTFWGSVERMSGSGVNSYNIISELSWRF